MLVLAPASCCLGGVAAHELLRVLCTALRAPEPKVVISSRRESSVSEDETAVVKSKKHKSTPAAVKVISLNSP